MSAIADDEAGYANPHLLVTPSELADVMARPDPPLLLDMRRAEAYAAGHLPGAVHLDLFGISLIDTDPAPQRAFLWILEHLLDARGVAASRAVVVYDEPYDFDLQVHSAFDPAIELKQGDTITIECTFDNPTNETIGFGESTNDEMCLAGLFVYPANQVICGF